MRHYDLPPLAQLEAFEASARHLSFTKAADELSRDSSLRGVLGEAFCDYWVNTRRWEWLMFHTTGGDAAATSVTQWELDRYFELV